MKYVYGALIATCAILTSGCGQKTQPIVDESSLQITGTTTETGTTTTTTQVTTTSGFLSYTNSGEKLSISYPSARTVQEGSFNSIVMFFTPLGDGDTFKENAGITKEALPEKMTLDAYYNSARDLLSGAIKDFKEISVTDTTINNLPAKKVVFAGKQDAFSIQWQQYVILKDTTIYVITYTALIDTFNQNLADFDAMAQSLVLQ